MGVESQCGEGFKKGMEQWQRNYICGTIKNKRVVKGKMIVEIELWDENGSSKVTEIHGMG